MARSVFNVPTHHDDKPEGSSSGSPETSPEASGSDMPRRKKLARGGAVADKYIGPATRGGDDRTYKDIPVDRIAQSAISDRIDTSEDLQSLTDSIRDHGQQIPITVRIIEGPLPYEIVVGRRRLEAIRSLGHPTIKAFVSRLDDRQAFITQGLENTARLETSYIERARAASLAMKAGFSQKDVSEFLNISQSLMHFMARSYADVGEDLVQAIGPARGIGRRKWDTLVQEIKRKQLSKRAVIALVNSDEEDSVERFNELLRSLRTVKSEPKHKRSGSQDVVRRTYFSGNVSAVRKPRELVIKLARKADPDLLERIDRILQENLDSDHMDDGSST